MTKSIVPITALDQLRSTEVPAPTETQLTFTLPHDLPPAQLISALQAAYSIKPERRIDTHERYFDTFDWRLFKRSLTLVCTAHHARLQSLPDERVECQTEIASPPVFLADIPPGELHSRVAKILDVRALLNLFELVSRHQTLRILNPDDKTVVLLEVEQYRVAGDRRPLPLLTRVHLQSVRGYAKTAKKVRQWLLRYGLTPGHGNLYLNALDAVHKVPNDYVSKPRFQLDPAMRADAATKEILRFLLTVMRRNEAGVIDNIDTEFLHDYRVAIRRTRSALGQIKGVFPTSVTNRFKRDFAALGSITNRARDLDVYLLKQDAYKAKLAPDHCDAIDPLFTMLRQERRQAQTALVRHLRSKKYHDLIERWTAFLHAADGESDSAPAASRPVLKVARKRIRKKCRAIVTLGNALLDSDDERKLHDLRIECKKLRYLLEFFDSLFPAKDVTPMVNQLRKLQDNLGDFNDLCVQEADLHSFAERFSAEDPQASPTRAAIGELIDVLDGEKAAVRKGFAKRFRAFADRAANLR